MTFPVQKPGGWTDDVDAIEPAQITNIGANLSNALDGANGGQYDPITPIVLGTPSPGIRIDNCIGHICTGPITLRSGRASIKYRLDDTTIDPATKTEWTIDSSNEIYIIASPCLPPPPYIIYLNIDTPGFKRASHGERILVRKNVHAAPQTDDVAMVFRNKNNTTATLGRLPALTGLGVLNYDCPYIWVEFMFDGNDALWFVSDASWSLF